LDEIDPSNGLHEVLQLLGRLESIIKIRICASSRPEFLLEKKFANYPKLRLHYLTARDTREYSTGYFEKKILPLAGSNYTVQDLRNLVGDLCSKADGVFLWVHLALRSLENGFGNNNDLSDIYRRLEELPNDLYDLFEDMWNRLGDSRKIYQKKAADYFNIAVAAHLRREIDPVYCLSVLDLVVALDSSIQEGFLHSRNRVNVETMRSRCQLPVGHIQTKCGGLLECFRIKGMHIST
jgi:hypothetical protein